MEMKDLNTFDSWTPEEIPEGFVCKAGTAKEYNTGGWRSMRPLWDESKCTSCMMCWVVCPDSSIEVEDGKMTGIDLEHCKGCGVCTHECKFDALSLVSEAEVLGGDK